MRGTFGRKYRKPSTLELGSVSSGTMRDDDLIPSFLYEARRLRMTREDRKTINDLAREYDAKSGAEDDDSAEDVSEITSELFDILDRYCPDYCYFGAHPGDGADYGVWVVEDLFYDTRQGSYDGLVMRGNDCPSLEDLREARSSNYSHFLHVNDHGNATLYRRASNRWIEVWSCV